MRMYTIVFAAVFASALLSHRVNALELGEPAPNFTLQPLAQTAPISLSKYKGRVVYLDFWASWCGPCRKSFPLLDAMKQALAPQGFEVLAINLDENKADALRFLKRHPVSFTTLHDPKEITPKRYGLKGMPSSYLIDRKGNVIKIHTGFKRADMPHIRQAVLNALKQ